MALSPRSILLPGLIHRFSTAQSIEPERAVGLLDCLFEKMQNEDEMDKVLVGVVPVKNDGTKITAGEEGAVEMCDVGCVARIIRLERTDDEHWTAVLEGISRFRIQSTQPTPNETFLTLKVQHIFEQPIQPTDIAAHALLERLRTSADKLLTAMKLPTTPITRRLQEIIGKTNATNAGAVADLIVGMLADIEFKDKLKVLDAWPITERLQTVIDILESRVEKLKVEEDIKGSVQDSLQKRGREFYLRQQLEAIRNELAATKKTGTKSGKDDEDDEDDLAALKKKIEAGNLPPEVKKVCSRELKRLQQIPPQQAEHNLIHTYLSTLLSIPWTQATEDKVDKEMVARAQKIMDEDHYGLGRVKKRLIEFLAVVRLKALNTSAIAVANANEKMEGDAISVPKKGEKSVTDVKAGERGEGERKHTTTDRAPILLLVGPPGVGKTSLARSVASALGRKFHRISLGGVRDEAEIRGHRRTYVGALPGVLVQALRKVQVNNPVILLDEIDKLGQRSHNGDPSAAMLEVLDPEQNWSFTDHYVALPVDLSKVLFIATANSLETIPAALLDRMETIEVPGYTYPEKLKIAQKYLVPKQCAANGLRPEQVVLGEDVVIKVATGWTREAGVRGLERELGSVVRAKAVQYAKVHDKDGGKGHGYDPVVTVEDLEKILGVQKFVDEIAERVHRAGVITGLAYSGSGNGGILLIEATDMTGSGRLQLTGNLKEVIKESALVALSWVKSNASALGLCGEGENPVRERDIHIHCPAGAIPKDGPSAGIAMTLAIISLLSHRRVDPRTAMTGEMTLRGSVLPIGGVKEKVIGAHRAGITKVLLPAWNRKDVEGEDGVPADVRKDVQFVYVKTMCDVLREVSAQHAIHNTQSHGPGRGLLLGQGQGKSDHFWLVRKAIQVKHMHLVTQLHTIMAIDV
ncbi:hypothetical protein YB2330_000796 [Saitoella coloradoensis]